MLSGAGPLAGHNVLVVEDRYLIASEMAQELGRLGAEVLGPCRDLASASTILDGQAVDMAVLDVNLDGEAVFPLAETLAARGVPFIFLTGYDEAVLPALWRDRPVLSKPVNPRRLCEALLKLRRAAR